jgi:hypothetical protein
VHLNPYFEKDSKLIQTKEIQMQGKIDMVLRFCNSEDTFSFDELVMKVADAFEHKAIAELLELIVGLIQEVLLSRIFAGQTRCHECGDGKLVLNGGYDRRIRTSLGELTLRFKRVKCSGCGAVYAPLQKLIQFRRYQTKTNELEKLVVETISETSYRRGAAQLLRDGKISLPYRTANEWILKTDCDDIQVSSKVIGSYPLEIMADGTKFKGEGVNGKARQGDIKAVIGITRQGKVFPMGTWTGASWSEINREWHEKNITLPDGSIIVCDGEPGLADSFADYVDEQQRCQWHIKRDLYHAMHADGAKKEEIKPLQDALAVAMAIELPTGDFQQVPEEDKDAIEERMENTEQAMLKFVSYLEEKGYSTAATYIDNARRSMFGYVRRWLKWGLISHKASTMVERVMRELARRLKNIAYGWSDKGAKKVAGIILKRFANASEWEEEWMQRMNVIGNVVISVGNYKCSSQDFAH